MDKDLYLMILNEVILHWEELGLSGLQKNQLESIVEKIESNRK